jgi:predicted RNase H-like nuclease (RuvC/YqgF family)
MNVVSWCALTGAVIAVVVYWLQERRRQALDNALDEARQAAAVAEARHSDLSVQHTAVSEDLRQAEATNLELSKERERLDANLKQAEATVLRLQSEISGLRPELESERSLRINLKASNAALEKEREGLGAQLVAQKTWVEEQTAHFEQRVLAAAVTRSPRPTKKKSTR